MRRGAERGAGSDVGYCGWIGGVGGRMEIKGIKDKDILIRVNRMDAGILSIVSKVFFGPSCERI